MAASPLRQLLLLVAVAAAMMSAASFFSAGASKQRAPQMDPAAMLLGARATVARQPAREMAAQQQDDYEIPVQAQRAEPKAAVSEGTAHAAKEPPAAAVIDQNAAIAAGCNVPPRPYHTLLTSSSGTYQAWQSRIMYHHFKLQKSRDPCGEMGGFTRLLTQRGSRIQDQWMDEIPTVVVPERSSGYPVINRPHSMLAFVNSPKFAETIKEDYVYIAETDHIMLRPMPNLATESMPAAFHFGYMIAVGQAHIVDLFVPGLGGKTDPVGPSPLIIHREQLQRVVQPWMEFTEKIMHSREAIASLGWVREMWGYCIAAANLGIKHRLLKAFQFEGGSIGNHNKQLAWPVPPTPVTAEGPIVAGVNMPYYLFHYTYGIEYSIEGIAVELQVGEWSLDKRHYMSYPPPRDFTAPPQCAHDRAHILRALYMNASAALPFWADAGARADPSRYHKFSFRETDARAHEDAHVLLGTGPWSLMGKVGRSSFRLDKLWVLGNGWLVAQKGHGRWGVVDNVITFEICSVQLIVKPVMGAAGLSLACASADCSLSATLAAPPHAQAAWRATPVAVTDALSLRLEGSGPFRGNVQGELYLLRAGVVQAFGKHGSMRYWRAVSSTMVALSKDEHAPLSECQLAALNDCWMLRFLTKEEAATTKEGALPAPPPKYGPDTESLSAEWIIRPAATQCTDVCTGLTLRQLTADDKAKSPLAAAVEECCTWSWAGFGGLKFNADGRLVTPWGQGVWGAPPEAQNGKKPALLAEFAGQQHLLRATLGEAGGKSVVRDMQSTRCNDNDQAHLAIVSGTPTPFN